MKKTIAVGPVAPGTPYSPAVLTGNTLYVSGQLRVVLAERLFRQEVLVELLHLCGILRRS